ncbi:hypothetical protein QGN29_07855 [Temperatibacter marinus]|uniref:Uncharacterized protein n=1 Tax=Temperatibacter marinus TaxID=1456591 RepID=A0AA52EA21_9PROT|nr:hypothetical protein [Temperatibacter marinus]WND01472.1 hypothetical protein QGN29_07855 [Temperatibacter marinus]
MGKKLSQSLKEAGAALIGRNPDYSWKDTADTVMSNTTESLKGLGSGTLTGTAEKFNEIAPYLARAGFSVIEIEVGIGLSPKVTTHLQMEENISDEEKQLLLIEVAEKKLVSTVLSSLFKAVEAREKLKFKKFHFTHLELELSILPSVMLKFRPDQSNALPDDAEDPLLIEKD